MSLTFLPEGVEPYAARHTEPVSPLLERLRDETYASMASPGMQVGQLEGTFLRLLVRLARARRVLEIGTFTGYSALCMAEGLPDDGELHTCDVDPKATTTTVRTAPCRRASFAQSSSRARLGMVDGRIRRRQHLRARHQLPTCRSLHQKTQRSENRHRCWPRFDGRRPGPAYARRRRPLATSATHPASTDLGSELKPRRQSRTRDRVTSPTSED